MQLALLPFVPLLLLPFIIVFFVVVFPLWGVALGVLGLLLLILRGLDWLLRRMGVSALGGSVASTHRVFRWVLTFGGLAESVKAKTEGQ